MSIEGRSGDAKVALVEGRTVEGFGRVTPVRSGVVWTERVRL